MSYHYHLTPIPLTPIPLTPIPLTPIPLYPYTPTIKPQNGTWISEGTVAPQTGIMTGEVKKGGGYQGLIDSNNIPKSTIIKTENLPKDFKND